MLMVKKRNKKNGSLRGDGTYVLKISLYLIVGSQWVWLIDPSLTRQIPIPAGLLVGLLFARHEHFKLDRKIEYAILLVAMLLGFWSSVGLYVSVL